MVELILTDLSEEATKRIASKQKPKGLKKTLKYLIKVEMLLGLQEMNLKKIGESIVSKDNKITYKYLEKNKILKK